jgi:hypothetical protein
MHRSGGLVPTPGRLQTAADEGSRSSTQSSDPYGNQDRQCLTEYYTHQDTFGNCSVGFIATDGVVFRRCLESVSLWIFTCYMSFSVLFFVVGSNRNKLMWNRSYEGGANAHTIFMKSLQLRCVLVKP